MDQDETQAAVAEDAAEAQQGEGAQEGQPEGAPERDEEALYEESLAAACMQVDERQVFYKTLRLVRTTHDDTELREAIAAFPEMACSVKTPRFFLERMRDTGALAVEEPAPEPTPESEPADAGAEQGQDAPAGADAEQDASANAEATAPESDEAAAAEQDAASAQDAPEPAAHVPGAAASEQPHHAGEHAVWTLTSVGKRVLEQLSATRRLAALYAKDVELAPAFDFVLDLCREPKKRAEVEAGLREQGFLDIPGIETSFYVDRLERDGGLVWDGGWLTTEDGLAFLEQKPEA